MIVRIYTGDDGQTHFEDLPPPAEESRNVALQAGANLVFRCFPADYSSDQQEHSSPNSPRMRQAMTHAPGSAGVYVRVNP